MKNQRSAGLGRAVMLLFVLVFTYTYSLARLNPQSSRVSLSVSDLHFNPFFDPSLVNALVKSNYTEWQRIFESSSVRQPNNYKSDSDYPLLKSALTAMQQECPQPAHIVISGDFLSHNFQDNFSAYAPNYPDSLNSFIAKTVNFIASMIDRYFPRTVVLPVLGNNDSDCGDYMIGPNSPFLSMFARAWVPLQRNGNAAKDSSFVQQFSKGGYYTFTFNEKIPHRVILLNTVFYSSSYSNSCGNPADDPAGTEMQWTDSILKDMNAKNEIAWMVYHIPPGVNVYSSLPDTGSCASYVSMMWHTKYNSAFLDLIGNYAPMIRAAFAGHTHMDDFRVIYANQKPISFIHITPAVSPVFSNNPGFQRITYNADDMTLQNAETFYLNLMRNKSKWLPEYNYRKTYGVKGINAAALDTVRQKIAANITYRNQYIKLYDVSNPPRDGVNSGNWRAFWCGTGLLTSNEYQACSCK